MDARAGAGRNRDDRDQGEHEPDDTVCSHDCQIRWPARHRPAPAQGRPPIRRHLDSVDVAREPMIAPSLLSADFAHLADEAQRVAGADWLHFDVMDAHFVPNLTFGLPVLQAVQAVSPVPLDCHLMIDDPDRWALGYAEAGARNVTVHAEACTDPRAVARDLRAAGALAGLALKPGTPLPKPEGVFPRYVAPDVE